MKQRMRLTVALLTAIASPLAAAQQYNPDAFLLGDWGGTRTSLHDRGLDFAFGYTNEVAHNTEGGQRTETTYVDQLMFDTSLDLDKAFGLTGAGLKLTLVDRNGEEINGKAGLGTLLSPQETYGYGNVTRVVQFYYQQAFGDRATLKLGRLPMSGDVFPFDCRFQNLTFCGAVPGYITPNWFTWPVSQWGAALNVKTGGDWEVQGAVYQVNPSFTKPSQGLNFGSPHGTTGYMAVGEVAWKPTFDGKAGSYRVGAWHSTAQFSDVYRDINGAPIGQTGLPAMQLNSATGFYGLAQQTLYQASDSPRAFKLFANVIVSDDKVSYVENLWHLGFYFSAPFAARPNDEIGLAVGRLKVNDDSARRISQATGVTASSQLPDVEYPVELYYGLQLTPAITLRPNVQYVHNPGGISADKDVVVLGLKTSISF